MPYVRLPQAGNPKGSSPSAAPRFSHPFTTISPAPLDDTATLETLQARLDAATRFGHNLTNLVAPGPDGQVQPGAGAGVVQRKGSPPPPSGKRKPQKEMPVGDEDSDEEGISGRAGPQKKLHSRTSGGVVAPTQAANAPRGRGRQTPVAVYDPQNPFADMLEIASSPDMNVEPHSRRRGRDRNREPSVTSLGKNKVTKKKQAMKADEGEPDEEKFFKKLRKSWSKKSAKHLGKQATRSDTAFGTINENGNQGPHTLAHIITAGALKMAQEAGRDLTDLLDTRIIPRPRQNTKMAKDNIISKQGGQEIYKDKKKGLIELDKKYKGSYEIAEKGKGKKKTGPLSKKEAKEVKDAILQLIELNANGTYGYSNKEKVVTHDEIKGGGESLKKGVADLERLNKETEQEIAEGSLTCLDESRSRNPKAFKRAKQFSNLIHYKRALSQESALSGSSLSPIREAEDLPAKDELPAKE